ncbi:uncharacterized protein BJ212DRAFT_1445250 [Suillus subaureus]|uniref:Uncharacterized protein n=1 Tax=Suillus subaureus TaxID=48587 RepID=A0A9P7EH95_9AGAM|nr:uncharacterized protein BJ212DRAFT_1445250 [Suillus subaureus]KAG1821772.1 hypothetical protein BJ212DRAFT_1445250 [Suillus subaureus]
MSNILRVSSKHARSLSQPSKTRIVVLGRLFHSPFVVLNSPSSPASNALPVSASLYEKQHDHSPEPQISSAGMRTYVVSEPDPANTPYAVPSGAYPTTAPYADFKLTDAPNPEGKHSASSTNVPYPHTTRAIPRNADGVGESASVRYGDAPGEMGRRGGSHRGLGLMDESGTHKGAAELPDRNPSPDSDVTLRWSKLGVENARKERK